MSTERVGKTLPDVATLRPGSFLRFVNLRRVIHLSVTVIDQGHCMMLSNG